jgi:hypothetical protein
MATDTVSPLRPVRREAEEHYIRRTGAPKPDGP